MCDQQGEGRGVEFVLEIFQWRGNFLVREKLTFRKTGQTFVDKVLRREFELRDLELCLPLHQHLKLLAWYFFFKVEMYGFWAQFSFSAV